MRSRFFVAVLSLLLYSSPSFAEDTVTDRTVAVDSKIEQAIAIVREMVATEGFDNRYYSGSQIHLRNISPTRTLQLWCNRSQEDVLLSDIVSKGKYVYVASNREEVADAGLLCGDLITAINGVPPESASTLSNVASWLSPGDIIALSVMRVLPSIDPSVEPEQPRTLELFDTEVVVQKIDRAELGHSYLEVFPPNLKSLTFAVETSSGHFEGGCTIVNNAEDTVTVELALPSVQPEERHFSLGSKEEKTFEYAWTQGDKGLPKRTMVPLNFVSKELVRVHDGVEERGRGRTALQCIVSEFDAYVIWVMSEM